MYLYTFYNESIHWWDQISYIFHNKLFQHTYLTHPNIITMLEDEKLVQHKIETN